MVERRSGGGRGPRRLRLPHRLRRLPRHPRRRAPPARRRAARRRRRLARHLLLPLVRSVIT